jgi:anaphase-promoting complex subunit 2
MTLVQPAFLRLGATVFSSYTLNFHTCSPLYLHPPLLPSKNSACLLVPSETDPDEEEQKQVRPNVHSTIWKIFEILGLVDRYKSIIASVGYDYIEEHMLKTCTG